METTKDNMLKTIGKAISIQESSKGRKITPKQARRLAYKLMKKLPYEEWVDTYNQAVKSLNVGRRSNVKKDNVKLHMFDKGEEFKEDKFEDVVEDTVEDEDVDFDITLNLEKYKDKDFDELARGQIGRIIEEPELDEHGKMIFDENGEPIYHYYRIIKMNKTVYDNGRIMYCPVVEEVEQ